MSFFSIVKNFLNIFADTLYPEDLACAACGRELAGPDEFSLCPECKKSLEFNTSFCAKCGAHMERGEEECSVCRAEERVFTTARAACVYAGAAKDMAVTLKNGNAWIAKSLSAIMAERWPYGDIAFDGCMAVPIDKRRLAERGFNQSALIAKELCAILNKKNNGTEETKKDDENQISDKKENAENKDIKFADGLIKIKHTQKQALLSGADRAANVRGAYALAPGCSDLTGKAILLIDDIYTTGATVSECAAAILKGGAAAVYVYAFATGR